jgi:hypothetical protein
VAEANKEKGPHKAGLCRSVNERSGLIRAR